MVKKLRAELIIDHLLYAQNILDNYLTTYEFLNIEACNKDDEYGDNNSNLALTDNDMIEIHLLIKTK